MGVGRIHHPCLPYSEAAPLTVRVRCAARLDDSSWPIRLRGRQPVRLGRVARHHFENGILVHFVTLTLQVGQFAEIAHVEVRGQRTDKGGPLIRIRVGKGVRCADRRGHQPPGGDVDLRIGGCKAHRPGHDIKRLRVLAVDVLGRLTAAWRQTRLDEPESVRGVRAVLQNAYRDRDGEHFAAARGDENDVHRAHLCTRAACRRGGCQQRVASSQLLTRLERRRSSRTDAGKRRSTKARCSAPAARRCEPAARSAPCPASPPWYSRRWLSTANKDDGWVRLVLAQAPDGSLRDRLTSVGRFILGSPSTTSSYELRTSSSTSSRVTASPARMVSQCRLFMW